MADDEGTLPITQEAVDSFTQKMLAWGETLPTDERVVMLTLLSQASSEADGDEEVAGFSMDLGLSPSQIARAKIPMTGGTLEGESGRGGGWVRLWTQSLPPKT